MKEIKGYEGLYSIDENGNVFGHAHGKTISSKRSGDKYRHVSLSKEGIGKNFDIHRLVALTHLPNPENKPQVNHINGIKTDNRVENLEWISAKENVQHAIALGLRHPPKGENHVFFGKPAHNRKNVINIETGDVFGSITEAAKKLNIGRTCVRDCLIGRQKTAGGFHWKFEEDKHESIRKSYTGERAALKKEKSRTKEGRIACIYVHQKRNSIRRKTVLPGYTVEQLQEWIMKQDLFHKIYKKWADSNYSLWLAPATVLIDNTKGYLFDNMTIGTFKENFENGR